MASVATFGSSPAPAAGIGSRIRSHLGFEALFAMFLLAGAYKSAPSLAFIQSRIDITLLTGGMSVVAGIWVLRKEPLGKLILGPRVRTYLLLYLLYATYALATHLVADTNQLGVIKAKKLLVFNTWSLLGAALCLRTPERATRLLNVLVVMCSAGVVNALLTSSSMLWQMFGAESYHQVGRAAMFGALISATHVLYSPTTRVRLLHTVLVGLCVTALIGSGTRHSMVGTIVGLVVIIFAALTGTKSIRSALRLPATMMLLIGGFYVVRTIAFSDLQTSWGEDRAMDSIDRLRTGQLGDMPRVHMWNVAFNIWLENPIFGKGFGSFWVDRGSSGSRQPHNIVLEHLCELGLVGLGFLIALVWMPLRDVLTRRDLRDDPIMIIFVALLMATLAGTMTSGDISDNRLLFPFSAVVIMSAYWPSARRAARRKAPPAANGRNPRYRPVGPP